MFFHWLAFALKRPETPRGRADSNRSPRARHRAVAHMQATTNHVPSIFNGAACPGIICGIAPGAKRSVVSVEGRACEGETAWN